MTIAQFFTATNATEGDRQRLLVGQEEPLPHRSPVTRRVALKVGALGLLAGGVAACTQGKGSGGRATLRVAVAPYLPVASDTERGYRKLNQYLADAAGMDLDMKVASDWAGVATAISAGQADIALMGPWGYALSRINGGAHLFATEKNFGLPTYKALIVGRQGSRANDFPRGAKGRSLALGDSGGFAAWIYPQYWFKTQGIDPKTYFRFTEGIAPAAILTQLANDQIDIGASWDSLRWRMIKDGTIAEATVPIIHESEPLPNGGYVHRAGLDQGLVRVLQTSLAAIDANKARALGIPEPNTGFVADSDDSYGVVMKMGRALDLIPGKI